MSMTRKVILPDHDFVVAARHKVIPSVYAAARIDEKGITYSGPTFIAIRSGKHDKSTASSHAVDFETLSGLPEFNDVMLTSKGLVKPVVIFSVDGGPDENPRFVSNLSVCTCLLILFLGLNLFNLLRLTTLSSLTLMHSLLSLMRLIILPTTL